MLKFGTFNHGPMNYGVYAVPEDPGMIKGSMTVQPAYPAPTLKLHHCQLCIAWFESSRDLDEHIRTDHPECSQCRARLQNHETLYAHLRDFHPVCDQCQERFRTPTRLEQHKTARQPCDVCTKPWCDLDSHRTESHPKCSYCDILVYDKSAYSSHKDDVHPKCDQCQTRFQTPALLAHHETLRQRCDVCVALSPELGYYCDVKSHQAASHVTCSCCAVMVDDNRAYKRHKDDVHPKCSQCQTRFRTRERFNEHGYSCELCPAEEWWCSQALLDDHQQTAHVRCDFSGCEKLLEDAEQCQVHKDMVHPKCMVCFRRFSSHRRLYDHQHYRGH